MISSSLARRLLWVLRLQLLPPLPALLLLFYLRKPLALLLHIPRKRAQHPMYLPEHAGLERLARNEAPGRLQIPGLDRHQIRRRDERLAAEEEDAAPRAGDAHADEQLDCFAQGLLLANDQHVRTQFCVRHAADSTASRTATSVLLLLLWQQYLVCQVRRIGTREHVRQSESEVLRMGGGRGAARPGSELGLGCDSEVR